MNATKITLLLLKGEGNSLRIAEIGNWIGVALAAPRTEWDELCQRPELGKAGVYILSGGMDPVSGLRRAYIGEAENVGERLKQHKTNEFWDSAIVFISRDDNVNKAHVRYLENRLLTEANKIGRFKLDQNQAGGAKLSEGDREVMEDFLYRIRQLLPVLGSDILIPAAHPTASKKPTPVSLIGRTAFIRKLRDEGNNWNTAWEKILAKYPGSSIANCKKVWEKKERPPKFVEAPLTAPGEILFCPLKGAMGRGHRTPDGDSFVVLKGSTAVLQERDSSEKWPQHMAVRKRLIADGTLVEKDDFYEFTNSFVFSSPSAAATVIHGGPANGLISWRTQDGTTLKELDA